MLPTAVAGAAATFITDYYTQSTGWRVAGFGGSAAIGALAGAWFWSLYYGSGDAYQSIGARLAF
jgi:hypothetical protein